MSGNLKWTANEFAKLRFAKYKGYRVRTIAKTMDVTERSISAAWSKLNRFEHSNMKPGTKLERNMYKGLQLESKVRSGLVDDMRQKWTAELDRARGITTVFTKPAPPREIPEDMPEACASNTTSSELENFVSINISINGAQLERILGKIFGVATTN